MKAELTKTQKEATQKGEFAWYEGKHFDANPYEADSEEYHYWFIGWFLGKYPENKEKFK